MLFITLMTKMSDTAEAKYEYDKNSPKLSRAPQGRRLGDERLEVLVVLVALRGKSMEEATVSTQPYSTSITQTMRL